MLRSLACRIISRMFLYASVTGWENVSYIGG
jgi:hypothetical protein